jgi:hypothetical protein
VQSDRLPSPIKSTLSKPTILAIAALMFALGTGNLAIGARRMGEELAPLFLFAGAFCIAVAAMSLLAFFMKRKS